MAENLNLYQKLAKIRALSDVVKKEKSGYGYKYADITTILANITAGMKKHGVSLIPEIVPGTIDVSQNVVTNTKFDKQGNSRTTTTTEMLVKAEMTFTWVNDDNPDERIVVPWVVIGSQSDPSQALGGGLTYCTRYFLTNYFEIAQADSDVDTYRSKQKAAEASEDKQIAESIIAKFDSEIKSFLADNTDKKDELAKFVKRFVKDGNYFNIKEPSLAAKLLKDFETTFISEGESIE